MLRATPRVDRPLPCHRSAPSHVRRTGLRARRAPEDDPALPLLHQVVYCSRADDVVDAAVKRIVATAQRHNPERGITGLLVFGSGVFFQWIEGPRAQISGSWRASAGIRATTTS
jgi:hypothetical protein